MVTVVATPAAAMAATTTAVKNVAKLNIIIKTDKTTTPSRARLHEHIRGIALKEYQKVLEYTRKVCLLRVRNERKVKRQLFLRRRERERRRAGESYTRNEEVTIAGNSETKVRSTCENESKVLQSRIPGAIGFDLNPD
ncbi:hypothetical protein Tco_1476540 [Tanacetum coccineum]